MYDKNNVFARIIRGELPADKIYEDEFALAFHNIHPLAKIHALVVPRGEYADIFDFAENAPADAQKKFWDAVKKTAKLVSSSGDAHLGANIGQYASVPHFHVHVMCDDKYINEA
ncbi:MAG: HIT domain-containing protein [Rickettsiales bacterium]|jgi:diadenosine tetraphosphate (Ap4A) HIT family hydrolase|nr:HIT domain-containing protein [Rickettsiales bacterium]